MNNIIRNFAGIKVICHLLLTAIWLYWGICVHPLTFGWIGWTILIGGGFTYLIVGAICLHEDHVSDFSDDGPWWAFGYNLTNLFLLGCMMYYTGLYPNNPSFLIWPAIFVATSLLLYGFNGFGSASLLVFITMLLWLSNWGINRWYDYCILIVSIIIAFFSIVASCFKYDEDSVSEVQFHLINIGLCSLVNVGLLSLLFFNRLLNVGYFYNILYITIEIALFLLVVTTRFITIMLLLIAGVIYWWKNTEITFSSLISDLSFEWMHSTWFQVAACIVGGILSLGLIGYIIYKLIPAKTVYIYKYIEQKLPMMYNGLSMTCPSCRKTIVTGKYEESAVRGIAKTTTKGLIGVGGVGAGAAAGSIFGPLGTLAGAVIGGIVTYHNNKQIDKGVDAVIDIWNYEVDGGRIVNFKCPICGNEWVETELYGEIEH